MSGGAGKVYFVLYLAVVLELLIIIVERDEAEEHLHAKQKETMKIVRSILSQLQAGAGTEGITTRPQDEVSVPSPELKASGRIEDLLGTDIKSERRYLIEVGVTDISGSIDKYEGEDKNEYLERMEKNVELANVDHIEYQIFYHPSDDKVQAPPFPSDSILGEFLKANNYKDMRDVQIGDKILDTGWELKGIRDLFFDKEAVVEGIKDDIAAKKIAPESFEPVYKLESMGMGYGPSGFDEEEIFYYLIDSTDLEDVDEEITQIEENDKNNRTFVVNFEPTPTEGWFKLRFDAKTNKILGIKGGLTESVEDDATVNIGTVQLKIKELKKVKKELEKEVSAEITKMVKDKRGAFVFADGEDHKSFMRKIKREISELEVSGDPKALDKISEVQLYGYIVTLLSPGMSKNFDQNQNTIEFNVRVNVLDPPPSEPIIEAQDEVYAFEALPGNFRFKIAPWRTGMNVIKGNVYTVESGGVGEPAASVSFEPVSENTPGEGQSRDYYGTISKALPAGSSGPREYIIKLEHSIVPNTAKKDINLTVFPNTVESDVNSLGTKLELLASYGGSMFFDFTPPSGQKIAADNFAIYFSTDADAQGKRIGGLSADRSDKLQFVPSASEASLRIVWIDPISREEVDIFPEKTVPIFQKQPTISTNFASTNIAGEDQVLVQVSNIKIGAPGYDPDDATKVATVNFDIIDTEVKVKGYRLVGKPKFTVNEQNAVTVNFILDGEPDEDGKVSGEVKLNMQATAINPLNNKASNPTTKPYTVPVRLKIEDAGGGRGGRGGGRRR